MAYFRFFFYLQFFNAIFTSNRLVFILTDYLLQAAADLLKKSRSVMTTTVTTTWNLWWQWAGSDFRSRPSRKTRSHAWRKKRKIFISRLIKSILELLMTEKSSENSSFLKGKKLRSPFGNNSSLTSKCNIRFLMMREEAVRILIDFLIFSLNNSGI